MNALDVVIDNDGITAYMGTEPVVLVPRDAVCSGYEVLFDESEDCFHVLAVRNMNGIVLASIQASSVRMTLLASRMTVIRVLGSTKLLFLPSSLCDTTIRPEDARELLRAWRAGRRDAQ